MAQLNPSFFPIYYECALCAYFFRTKYNMSLHMISIYGVGMLLFGSEFVGIVQSIPPDAWCWTHLGFSYISLIIIEKKVFINKPYIQTTYQNWKTTFILILNLLDPTPWMRFGLVWGATNTQNTTDVSTEFQIPILHLKLYYKSDMPQILANVLFSRLDLFYIHHCLSKLR